MSDLISTPSQTQSAVSNEAFEVLIDLLASDGIDENPPTFLGDPARTQPNVNLRDSSGKLDFHQIRRMFAAQNENHRVRPPIASNEDQDSDDEPHSHRSTSSMVPSRSNSMSPKPVERAPSYHRRSSTFGNQPGVAIHENTTAAKEVLLPTLSHQPLSFDELNSALALAHGEVRNLRQQYDGLQALVSTRLATGTRDQVKPSAGTANTEKIESNKDNRRVETRSAISRAQPSASVPPVPPSSDVPAEIASLSENEAKRALSAVVHSLNISPSSVCFTADPSSFATYMPPQLGSSPPTPTQRHDLSSISRAVKFLHTVDELVWRRASGPSGSALQPVFSEENVDALVARLVLWERTVRRSSRA